jgi:hypothetical protein
MIRARQFESALVRAREVAQMADGSKSEVLEAETAVKAKVEAPEVKSTAAPSTKATAPAAKTPARKAGRSRKAGWAEFVVDIWITDFHSVKFGIYQHARNQAKSRQFTSDMDIYAEVIENGERTGLLGYREDLWRKNAGMDKRLVLKLFNETVNWRASMDLMIGRSLQLTLGARGLPVTAFSINANDHEDMIYLERSANKWPLAPENFSFFLLDDGKPRFYRLRRDVFNLSGDYTLYSHRNEAVGRLDGKLFTLGGKWRGRVHPDHASPRLLAVLQLFCGMLIFNGGCRRHVRRLAREVLSGRYEPRIEKQEADLYMNPRRVR